MKQLRIIYALLMSPWWWLDKWISVSMWLRGCTMFDGPCDCRRCSEVAKPYTCSECGKPTAQAPLLYMDAGNIMRRVEPHCIRCVLAGKGHYAP